MANRDRNSQYIALKALKAIFQQDDSEFKDSDISSEEVDRVSECSDYSDTESLEQSSSDQNKNSIRFICDDKDQSSGVSVQSEHDNHTIERD